MSQLTTEQKIQNEHYFRQMMSLTKEGGVYGWPAIGENFIVKGNKFYGTERGVSMMKEITPKAFHKHIKKKEEKTK